MDELPENLKARINNLMLRQHFHFIAVGVVDFEGRDWKGCQYAYGRFHNTPYFYDLASLTKPLTLGLSFLKYPKLWEERKLAWLLNHRASFPIGGRLSKDSWRDSVNAYIPVVSSKDVYSDFSALRLQLEIEKELQEDLYSICRPHWSEETLSWLELESDQKELCPPTGYRLGRQIMGDVHDDNAFVIKEKLSHAGLFSTLRGTCQTLLLLDADLGLLSHMRNCFKQEEYQGRRFVRGFDTTTLSQPKKTLAGSGCSSETFGHLGFTGTSFWIDPVVNKGLVILSNATQNYWYDKSGINLIRRELGQIVWSYFRSHHYESCSL